MTKTFVAFGEDDEDGQARRELTQGFDFEAVDRGLGTVEAMDAVVDGHAAAQEMLSHIIEICAEGLSRIDRIDRRASAAGLRVFCIGLAMRPGQVETSKIREVASLLGVTHEAVRKVLVHVRRRIRSRT